jgi:hypothetical protein
MFSPKQDGREEYVYNGKAHRKCITLNTVKLSLCKPWRRNEGTEAKLHSFLTSTLGGGEWSASYPSHFAPPVKNLQYPLNRELSGPLTVWMFLEKKQEKNLHVLVLDIVSEIHFVYFNVSTVHNYEMYLLVVPVLLHWLYMQPVNQHLWMF